MREDGDWPIMRGERTVRFVCGVVAGLFAGFEPGSRLGLGRAGRAFVVVATAVGFGFSAAFLRYEFWSGLGPW